jgi:beta-lactamase regulating signal transducer with metallopeptidase domain
MSVLARFDPGDAVTAIVLLCLIQTTVVILAAAVCGGTILRHRASARHGLWLGTLMLVLLSPAVAAVADRSSLKLWAIPLTISEPPAIRNADAHGTTRLATQSDSTAKNAKLNEVPTLAESEPMRPVAAMAGVDQGRVETHIATAHEVDRLSRALLGGLSLLWAVGALAGVARIAGGWRRVAALARSARVLDPVRHVQTLERVRATLGVAALPPLVTSPEVRGPVAVGLLRPRVFLPEGLAESIASDAFRDVLIHECAHVVRLDAWVGVLQRLAGVLLWPHPLVHYANGELTRAREEVCDNHVLRCGDPGGYARTLLALTVQCWPVRVVRPGLGLLGARWTLADRVAGLLDTRRTCMTRTTLRMKIALALALTVTGLVASSVRLDRSARADKLQAKPAEPRAAAAPPVWSVEGIVVDEGGRPVAGAVVGTARDDGAADGSQTAADGAFTLALGGRNLYIWGVVAETDGGARIGLVRFENAREFSEKDPVKIVLKPSRPVRVHVNDAAGSPVPGAAVEAIDDDSFRTSATTGPDGTAVLRVAADAKAMSVIGLKAGAGFDYFENHSSWPFAESPPLPADVTLNLDSDQIVRVKAVDPKGEPVSGVEIGIGPMLTSKIGKVRHANLNLSESANATTDREGVATFDWLPKSEVGAFRFRIATGGNYSIQSLPDYQRGGPAELTAHLVRDTRLSGTVRFPDGRPAGGVLILAANGIRPGAWIRLAARTLADGSYVLDAPSEWCYIVAVVDETWAAPSLSNVIVREGRELRGLDLTLTKGTFLHGQVTKPSDHWPVAGAVVYLCEVGAPLPKELRGSHFRTAQLHRRSIADASGRYHFRVGPGRYTLLSLNAGGTKPLVVEVKNEAEIVRDLTLKGPAR